MHTRIKLSYTDDIYVSSDFHLGHKNMVRGISNWPNKEEQREFDSLKEHDEFIIDLVNANVPKRASFFFLGDFMFSKKIENIADMIKKINCDNIYFIIGNHDDIIEKNMFRFNSIDKIKYLGYQLKADIGGKVLFMTHFPHFTWEKSHLGSYNLHGHEHNNMPLQKDPNTGLFLRQMDVSIEGKKKDKGSFKIHSFEEIDSILSSSMYQNTNHHGKQSDR